MLVVLTLFASMVAKADPAIAELALRGQLRDLVEYPKSSCFFGVFFTSDGVYRFQTDPPAVRVPHDPRAEIEKLSTGKLGHMAMSQLSSQYEAYGEEANARACERMGISLCRQHLRTHPDDIEAMATLAHLLAGSRCIEEAEKWLRISVSIRPRDWHVWERLGWHYVARAFATLLHPNESIGKPIRIGAFDYASVVMTVSARLPEIDGATRRRAFDFCEKARDAFDWGVIIAPEMFESRASRYIVSGWLMPITSMLLSELSDDDKRSITLKIFSEDSSRSDLRTIAELTPDPRGYGMAFFLDLANEMIDDSPDRDRKLFNGTGVRDFYERARKRLYPMTLSGDPITRGNALRIVALIEAGVLENQAAALAAFRKIPFDAKDRGYYEFAKFLFMMFDNADEVVQFFERWIKCNDEAIAYFDLVNTLFYMKKKEEARIWLHKGILRHPGHFELTITLIADLLQRGDDRILEQIPFWMAGAWVLHDRQRLVFDVMGTVIVPVFGRLLPCSEADITRFRTSSRLLYQCNAVYYGLAGMSSHGATFAKNAVMAYPAEYGNALQIMTWLETDAQKARPPIHLQVRPSGQPFGFRGR